MSEHGLLYDELAGVIGNAWQGIPLETVELMGRRQKLRDTAVEEVRPLLARERNRAEMARCELQAAHEVANELDLPRPGADLEDRIREHWRASMPTGQRRTDRERARQIEQERDTLAEQLRFERDGAAQDSEAPPPLLIDEYKQCWIHTQRQAPTRDEVLDAIEYWMPPGVINNVTPRQLAIDVLDTLTDAEWLTVRDDRCERDLASATQDAVSVARQCDEAHAWTHDDTLALEALAMTLDQEGRDARARFVRRAVAELADAQTTIRTLAGMGHGGHEWECPSCGATTRARMADGPEQAVPTRSEVLDEIEYWMPPGVINNVTPRQRAIDVLDTLTDAEWLTVRDDKGGEQ